MQQFIPFNPYMTPQQRLLQMEQQYPQLAQPQPMQVNPTTNSGLSTIPVSNMEEANAFRVDLNGSPTFFYNAGKNEVYMKRTNTQTGLADFAIFSKVEQVIKDSKQSVDVSNYEKNFKVLNDKIDSFTTKLNDLYVLFSTASDQTLAIEQVSATTNVRGNKHAK